ncbi:MAG: FAD-binding protein [Polyangiaceae bacterium]|nr:FAD-binding protein [Polyangiaceae bacterium]
MSTGRSTSKVLRSAGGKVRRVAVVGGGVAGSMTALELVRAGVPVDLFSLLPARRSPSVSAHAGINAALDPEGEGDSPRAHFEDTLRAGEYLANQPLVFGMTEAAPSIVHSFDRMGVPFHRTGEGRAAVRRLSGVSFARAAFAGATTGQQVLYALDQQLRRFEAEPCVDARGMEIPGEPLVRKLEHWDFLSLVRDDAGVCIGLVAQDLRSMAIKAYSYDAVVLATGGFASLFATSAASVLSTGTAAAAVYRQGAAFANAEFVELHATALHTGTRPKIISEAARAEGARLWVPRDPKDVRAPRDIPERERDYFLERLYPQWDNLVAGDVAARAIHRLCVVEGAGVCNAQTRKNENAVYLDLTQVASAPERLERLRGVTDIAARFAGVSLQEAPLKVFPAIGATLGGLWVDYEADTSGRPVPGSPRNHATTIPGLYAVGEVAYPYHGAHRLAGNGLLACAYGATLCGPAVVAYRSALAQSAYDLPRSIFDKAAKLRTDEYNEVLGANQDAKEAENPHVLADELGTALVAGCGVTREDEALDAAASAIEGIAERCGRVKVPDTSARSNQSAPLARRLGDLVALARVVVASARHRTESRGTHHRAKAEERDDRSWLVSTLAIANEKGAPKIVEAVEYACVGTNVHATSAVDTRLAPPRAREIDRPHALGRVALTGQREGKESKGEKGGKGAKSEKAGKERGGERTSGEDEQV